MGGPDTILPGIFGALAPVLDSYGYLAVGGFILVEDFGVPLPGETILIAAAVYAGAGRLSLALVVVVAVLAAVTGDNIGYVIGRYGGRRLVLRWGRYVLLTPQRLDRVEEFVHRHGAWVVTLARFIEGLRQANGIVAGIGEMTWTRRFLPFNMLGAALWVGVWTAVGYVAGSHLDVLYAQFKRYEIYLLIVLGVGVVAMVARTLWRRHRSQRTTRHA